MNRQSLSRRIAGVILSAALAGSLIVPAAAADSAEVFSEPVKVSGTVVNGRVSDSLSLTLNFDYRWLTEGDPNVFHRNLAELAVLLSTDAYDTGAVTMKLTGTPDRTDNIALLQSLGLEDVRQISVGAGEDGTDADDTAEFVIGHRTVVSGENSCEVYVVSIQGTNGSLSQWESNFDVGSDSESYTARTGEHPDWENHQHHKGFDVAANRVMREIAAYVSAAGEEDGHSRVFFVAGHSRGGAVANLLGKMLTDKGETAFTYTVAAPHTTLASVSEAGSYITIYNILNVDDLVPYLPMAEWGYTRYGTDFSVSVSEDVSARSDATSYLKAAYYGQDMAAVGSLFSTIASGRDSLYNDDVSAAIRLRFGSAAALDEETVYLNGVLRQMRGEKYCSISQLSDVNGVYQLDVKFCPALLLRGLGAMMSYPDIKGGGDVLLGMGTIMNSLPYSRLLSELVNTAWNNPYALTHPHYTASYLAAVKALPEEAAPAYPAQGSADGGTENTGVFSDVSFDRWSAGAVEYVYDNALMNGTGHGMFTPAGKLSRGMMMTILARMAGADTTGGDPWYQPGLEWAAENGISDGSHPENNVTREQMMTMLYRYAQTQGEGFTGSWYFLLDFEDRADISDWADEAAHWCVMKGIVEGDANGMLRPGDTCTREQAAAMLMRFCQVM